MATRDNTLLIKGNKPQSFKRQNHLDYIKAIAITLVFIYHCQTFEGNLIVSSLLSMCVALFFCVNGYLMLIKHHDSTYFLRKNIKLLFLILFWGSIACIIGTWNKDNSVFVPKTMLLHLYNTDIGYGNQMWFLFTLIILNFLNPIIYFFINNSHRNERIIFFTFIGLCSINFIQLITWQFNPLRGWHGYALFYYIMGYYCLACNKDKIVSTKNIGALFIFFIILQSSLNYAMSQSDKLMQWLRGGDFVFSQYSSLFVICSTLLLVLFFKRIQLPESKIITFIGSNTLGLYLIQDVVIKYLKYGLHINQYPIIYIFMVFTLCCIIIYIFNRFKVTRFLIST